jgi:4-hydroxy-3-methylbut-2-enyl diphosphate reductase
MKVLVAEVLGMCFGVRDALKTIEGIDDPGAVTIHGELVHNEVVLEQLNTRGFHMTREMDRRPVPATPRVLITAHGVSNVERRRLAQSGKELVDTTCPLVARVHKAALELQAAGYHVLVIGRRGHVEVQGIIEDLASFDLIQNSSEVQRYPYNRLGIVCQTTSPARHVQQIREAVAAQNPHAEIRFVDTVCHPTKDHQRALERLAEQVDAMVVVGGRNSNNTRELVAFCRDKDLPAFHVQGAADLRPEWFTECATVGLTAGTSTLDTTIAEVRRALECMNPANGRFS